MARYVIDIAYKGTAYQGWQAQENTEETVQNKVDAALSTVLRTPVSCYGAGRTDAGVHATQMPAHFDYNGDLPSSLLFSMNAILPRDISITAAYRATRDDFHARFDAVSRAYRYYMHFEKNPFHEGLSGFCKFKLDIDKLNEAAQVLKEFDSFETFCKAGGSNKTHFCKIMDAHWTRTGDQFVFYIRADRFLRGMVRAIVGTLSDAGRGKMTPDQLRTIIAAKDRGRAGTSVSPDGLYLVSVEYKDGELVRLNPVRA